MAKIYIITSGSYSDYGIQAVFSTYRRAKAYRDKYNSKDFGNYDKAQIETYDIDIPSTEWVTYTVIMKQDGNVLSTRQSIGYYIDSNPVSDIFYDRNIMNSNLVSSVKTDNKERAIKITNERRIQEIANNTWGVNPKRK